MHKRSNKILNFNYIQQVERNHVVAGVDHHDRKLRHLADGDKWLDSCQNGLANTKGGKQVVRIHYHMNKTVQYCWKIR